MRTITTAFILMSLLCSSSLAQERSELSDHRRDERDADAGIARRDAERGARNPGTLKWKLRLGGNVGFCSPAIGKDGTIYTGAGQRMLYALNPDGTEKWSLKTSGWVMGAPAVGEDGTIYLGTHTEEKNSHIHAYTSDGQERWSCRVADTIPWSSPAIAIDGTIYVGCYDGRLYAMNPNGTNKWSFQTGHHIWSSPAIGQDGTIYIPAENGKLYAVNPKDGTEKWSFHGNSSRSLAILRLLSLAIAVPRK